MPPAQGGGTRCAIRLPLERPAGVCALPRDLLLDARARARPAAGDEFKTADVSSGHDAEVAPEGLLSQGLKDGFGPNSVPNAWVPISSEEEDEHECECPICRDGRPIRERLLFAPKGATPHSMPSVDHTGDDAVGGVEAHRQS